MSWTHRSDMETRNAYRILVGNATINKTKGVPECFSYAKQTKLSVLACAEVKNYNRITHTHIHSMSISELCNT
jgi:hypothetical protein